ncbi:aminodeoxychorismate lyase [Aeromonas diversa]|uniref:Aminodeoxychorismate lyase n=1 Tax=Aeromonas diversa CDC 2478-85 TaxID=1268237 RepID=N9V9Y4_9GAMM|nr:aminodeoxychorismate lyase [Aeromonas diversa]ENY72077.1 4-amino-4-deoxychorismate lyase [Aeromonas diversa CDC 2478-85]
MSLINGRKLDRVEVTDRGLAYGDGHFTTMKVVDGRIERWEAHLARLQKGCQRLGIVAPDWSQLAASLHDEIAGVALGCAKVMITRGSGGRGYSPAGCHDTRWIVTLSPFPEHYLQWQSEGIEVVECRQRVADQPMLAGIKSLNRLEQVLLRQELNESNAVEGVVLSTRNVLVAGVSANLFWRRDKTVFTPDLSHGGVDGVMRRTVMGMLKEMSIELRTVEAPLESLWHAEEVWMTNALMGVVPVTRIAQQSYPIGAVVRYLQERLLIDV